MANKLLWLGFILLLIRPPSAAQNQKLEITKIADGVYGAIYSEFRMDPIEGNSLIVINNDGVLVLDSCRTPDSARAMIAVIRKLTDKPVRYVVNSHLFESLVSQARDAAKRGLSLEEARKVVNLESFRTRLAGDDPVRNGVFRDSILREAIERTYKASQTNAPRRALDLYFIDVEGGAATLIVTPAGESVLIDAGWDGFDGRDAKRIQQAMRQAGVTAIDHLVVTHYHRDHYGGVPELASLVPIKRFYDHGKMTSLADDPQFTERYGAYQAAAKSQTIALKPGDTISLKSADGAPPIKLLCVAARAATLNGAGASANPECTSDAPNEDSSDNARSVALLLKFGDFEFLNLADLSWNISKRLVCQGNQIGEVDLYQATHHGGNVSNDPALLRSLRPTVAVMINGPRKGGHPDTIKWLRETPSFKALYQLHRNVQATAEQNTPVEFIANLDEQPDEAHMIRVSVDAAKRAFTVTNGRTKERRSYQFK
jgi:beta-lactamase superfamily II metal-dependent hydrolase